MGDPIYSRFDIQSKTKDCVQTPTDPKQDSCKITVQEDPSQTVFTLERKGSSYQVATSDASKVSKAFPNYRTPTQALSDFLLVRGEFYKAFGDKENPTEIVGNFKFFASEKAENIVDNLLGFVTNFVAHGELTPTSPTNKKLEERGIKSSVYTFVDPTFGTLAMKALSDIKDNTKLSPEARKRIAWILSIQGVREQLWNSLKSMTEKSQRVGMILKGSSSDILTFLFANHLLADKGSNDFLFSEDIKSQSKEYHELMSKLDPQYNASKNFYAVLRSAVSDLQNTSLPEEYKKDFLLRVNYVDSEYGKAAQEEMIRILASEPTEQAYREYLKIKYGTGTLEAAALDIILANMSYKDQKDGPNVSFAMDKIAEQIKKWGEGLPLVQQSAAKEAVNGLLNSLFADKGKIEVFLDKKIQSKDNFSATIPVLGASRNSLKDLIAWSGGSLTRDNKGKGTEPVGPMKVHGWSLGTELGVGVVGLGTAAALIPLTSSKEKYYGQGAAVILGSSGFGAAAGNALAYAFKVDKHSWAMELGGAVLGGLAGGLIYGFTNPYPNGGMSPVDPGTRYPVDPYGP